MFVLAGVLLIAIPVGLGLGSGSLLTSPSDVAGGTVEDRDAAPDATAPDAEAPDDAPDAPRPDDEDAGGNPDPEAPDTPSPPEPVPPDLDSLSGVDAEFGRLLLDIDASERAMIAFQDDLRSALQSPPAGPDALRARIREVAAERQRELLGVRERLEPRFDDLGAEGVRDRYVVHLDSWADYMGAIEEDPSILAAETDGGFTVAINATADAFSRALEAELERGLDGSVERFAEAILDRGFRGFGQAEV